MSKPDDPVVFVSYRQADRPAAAREVWRALHDSLAMVVFKDDATIGVGRSINETVKSHLQRSVVLVPIIGPGWFDPRPDEVVPPVFDDDDWVRYEIRYALENDIPIVPVYVSGMRFLRAKDLPEDLRGLVARGPDSDGGFNRGVSIAGDERAERDIAAFIDKLAAEFDLPRKPAGGAEPAVAEWRPAADWELRHCERLEEQLGALRPALPPRDGPQQWPMDQVFVPLEVHTRRLGAQGESLDWERLIAADRMVLSGGPGSGKSTLLAHLALTAAAGRRAILAGGAGRIGAAGGPLERLQRLPVWIDLPAAARRIRNHKARGNGDKPARLRDLAADDWLEVVAIATNLDNRDQAKDLLDGGAVLLILDGLDEVGDPREREALVESIARLPTAFGTVGTRNPLVVGCRDRAWGAGGVFAPFEVMTIRPMDRARWEQYLARWCRAVWADEADAVLAHLGRALRSERAVQEMASNPQTATMLAVLAHSGPLPTRRIELYDSLVQAALRGDALKRFGDSLAIRAHLGALAMAIQSGANGEAQAADKLSLREAQRVLGERLADPASKPSKAAIRKLGGELLAALELHTGLIATEGGEVGKVRADAVRFKHRTIQEFLVASRYVDEDESLEILVNASNPAWIVAIALTAALLAVAAEEAALTEFLGALAETPELDTAGAAEIDDWSKRMGTLSACLEELWDRDLPESVLAPAVQAHEASGAMLMNLDLAARVAVAEGMGTLRDPRLEPQVSTRWVRIAAGTSALGSPSAEAWVQERPWREVRLSEYRIQRWPVTVREYARFVDAARGYHERAFWDEAGWAWRLSEGVESPEAWELVRSRGNRPVTGIAWWEARAYARWLGTVEDDLPAGWSVTLPTEAQWERAARGPHDPVTSQRARFPWGTDWQPGRAHCLDGQGPQPVGLRPDGNSPEGIWDLAGNVAEYCLDGFGPPDQAAGAEQIDPCRTDLAFGPVVRGGGYDSPPLNCRVSARFPARLDPPARARSDALGFRCVAWPAPRELV